MAVNSDDESMKQMKADGEFFSRMLNLIPPRNYFGSNVQTSIVVKQIKKAKTAALESGKSKNGDKTVSKKSLLKRMKYNPDNRNLQLISEANDINDSDSSVDDIVEVNQFTKIKNKKTKSKNVAVSTVLNTPSFPSSTKLEDARQRLHEKLEEFKLKRKLSASDAALKNKMKRRNRKLKLQMKREEQKKVNSHEIERSSIGKTVNGVKPVYNKDNTNVVFSKFDFSESGKEDKKGSLSGKNYKRLLEKVEKRNNTIENLKKNNDADKAQELESRMQWDKALEKAEGKKVKDDVNLLKKSLKRKQQQKSKSHKKWEEREAYTQKMKSDRQDKRQRNIRQKKDSKLKRKIDQAKKRGRVIPGF